MSYEKVQTLVTHLEKTKNKTPEHIKNIRTELETIHKQIGDDELTNIKIHYQSQLTSSAYYGNTLAIVSLVIAVFFGIISFSGDVTDLVSILMVFGYILFILVVLVLFLRLNSKMSKQHVSYTIIINLIDDIV